MPSASAHLEMLKWINSLIVVIALIVIGISAYAGFSAQGHFNSAYAATAIGVVMEILACCGLLGAKMESVGVLVVYFWVLFLLITGQVIITVLTFFRRDEVFSFVSNNASKFALTSQDEIQSLVTSIENNLAFLGVCLGVLVLVQSYALVLAATHFKRACLSGLNTLTKSLGHGAFFIGIGVYIGASSTEAKFGHTSFFAVVLVVVGLYLYALGSLGLHGLNKESPALLGVFFWIMFITVIVEVVGGSLLMFRRDAVMELVRQKMSAKAAEFSDREISATVDMVRSHVQITVVAAFLLIFQQTLAIILSLKLRSELRGVTDDESLSSLLDRELLDVIPGVAGKGRDLLKDYSQPSRWSDAYENVRRRYDDFD